MNKHLAIYIGSLLLAGTNGLIANNISMTSTDVVFYRCVLGSAMILAIFLLRGGRFTFMHKRRASAFLVCAGVAMGANWMSLYAAFRLVGVSVGVLSVYCGPMIVIALSPIVFGERLTLARIVAFVAVLFGMVLVIGEVVVEGRSIMGIICCVLSAVTYAMLIISIKKASKINGMESIFIQLFIGMLTIGAFLLATRGSLVIPRGGDVLPMIVFGILNTGIGSYMFFVPMAHLSAQTIVTLGYLEPFAAVVLSAIFVGERMTIGQMIGGALIICGSIFGELSGRVRRARAGVTE